MKKTIFAALTLSLIFPVLSGCQSKEQLEAQQRRKEEKQARIQAYVPTENTPGKVISSIERIDDDNVVVHFEDGSSISFTAYRTGKHSCTLKINAF